jgi:parallel beta-helix repeat protein
MSGNIKLNLRNMTFKQFWITCLVLSLLFATVGVAAYFGADVSLNVDLQARISELESDIDAINGSLVVHWNPTFYTTQKPVDVVISILGSYYTAQNGSTAKLITYSTNATTLFNSVIGADRRIVVLSGTYNLSGSTITADVEMPYSNFELIGIGMPTITLDPVNQRTPFVVGDGLATYENVTIQGFKFDNAGGVGYGVLFNNVTNSVVRDCHTYGGGVGVELYGSSNNRIEDCTLSTQDIADAKTIAVYQSDNNTIINNYMYGSECGISLEYDIGNTISNNQIRSNSMHGILLTLNSERNTIMGNVIQNNGQDGIRLESQTARPTFGNIISGNAITHNGDQGVHFVSSSNNTIQGNTIEYNSDHGIVLNSANETSVMGNTIQRNTQYGVYLITNDQTSLIGNNLEGNGAGTHYISGSSTNLVCLGNIGLITEAGGIASGTTPIQVAHGLSGTPDYVLITGQSAAVFKVSYTVNATHIVIYHDYGSSISVSWYGKYIPP